MSRDSAYSTLNLRKGATDEQIKEAYVKMVKRYDPERHTDRFMVIQNAFERLSDPVKRAQVDVFTFNPVTGRMMYSDDEKRDITETENAGQLARLEQQLSGGNGSEESYQKLALALMQRSAIFMRRKVYEKAIDSWDRILHFDPTHQRAKNNMIYACSTLAFSYAEHDLYEEAIEKWVRASRMNPDDDATLHNLALACEAAGRKDEAEKYWGETLRRWKLKLERSPDDEFLRHCILEVHRHHGGKMLDEAIHDQVPDPTHSKAMAKEAVREYKEILKIDPNDFEAQFQVASNHYETQDWPEAVSAFKKLRVKFPRNVEVSKMLGWAMLNSGQIDPAFQVWRLGLKADPKNYDLRDTMTRAHLELGKRCREQGQYNSALKHYKSLLKLLGLKNPEVHFEIGKTYFQKGDRRAAYMSFQSVLKLDSKNQDAKKMLQELRMR